MNTPRRSLASLNADTFRAENREGDWEALLRSTLADDFVLRRANKAKPDEDADMTIAAIANDTRQRTLLEQTVRIFEGDTVGVVTSVVELTDAPAPEDQFFQNVKVFQRVAGDDWQLTYWQVSGKPAP
jgi:hypothetical protein